MKAGDHDRAISRLAALAQATRLSLFRLLVEAGPAGLAAGVIAERLGVAAPTLSFHLKELSRAGLVRASQEGRYVIYTADFAAMNGLVGYLTENCCGMRCETAASCTPNPGPRPRARKRAASSSRRSIE